jgi:hypothetical protein
VQCWYVSVTQLLQAECWGSAVLVRFGYSTTAGQVLGKCSFDTFSVSQLLQAECWGTAVWYVSVTTTVGLVLGKCIVGTYRGDNYCWPSVR